MAEKKPSKKEKLGKLFILTSWIRRIKVKVTGNQLQ